MKPLYDFSQSNKRPSSEEGFNILAEIIQRHKLDYVAQAFHVFAQTVKKWFMSSNDLFTRVKYFLQRLREDGDEDLAIRLTQFWCASIGRDSVPQPERTASFLSLLQAVTACNKESSDIQVAFGRMVADQIADLKEIEAAEMEVKHSIEADRKLLVQLEFLKQAASENGGQVIIDMQVLRRLVVQN